MQLAQPCCSPCPSMTGVRNFWLFRSCWTANTISPSRHGQWPGMVKGEVLQYLEGQSFPTLAVRNGDKTALSTHVFSIEYTFLVFYPRNKSLYWPSPPSKLCYKAAANWAARESNRKMSKSLFLCLPKVFRELVTYLGAKHYFSRWQHSWGCNLKWCNLSWKQN